MPSGISQNMLTEITRHNERVYATFELTLNGMQYRFSDLPIASAGSGQYLKRVTGWDEFERPFGDRSYHLVQASGGVQVEDLDNTLGKVIGGGARHAVLNASATAHWRSDFVPNADHYKFFDGRVIGWSMPRARTYHFELGPDVLALESLTNSIPKITSVDWPRAPEAIISGGGSPGQIIYGRHRSTGVPGSAGMVKAIPVEPISNWWYLSIGLVKLNLVAVYRNGVEETANWTHTWTKRGSGWYSIIRDNGTADMEADTVYVDLDGVESVGDGSSGNLITAPSDILQHFLVNFVFNKWTDRAALVTSDAEWISPANAPINTAHFATTRTFLSNRQHASSRVLTTNDRGIDVLNDFCESNKVSPFWAWDWTLGILPLDYSVQDITAAEAVRFSDFSGEPSANPRTDSILNKISVRWLRDDAAGQLRQGPVSVQDSNRTPLVSEDLNLNWVEASLI